MTARPKSQPLTLAPWLDDGYRHIWMPYTQMQTAPEPEAVTATQGVGMAIVIGGLVLVVRRDARSAAATGAS